MFLYLLDEADRSSIAYRYLAEHIRDSRVFCNQQVWHGFVILNLNAAHDTFRLNTQS